MTNQEIVHGTLLGLGLVDEVSQHACRKECMDRAIGLGDSAHDGDRRVKSCNVEDDATTASWQRFIRTSPRSVR